MKRGTYTCHPQYFKNQYKISLMCKNVLSFLPILTPENSSQTNIVTTNLVKTMFLNYCNGVLSEKKTVELKFITSVPPYRLNNLETRISGFAENSILAALEHLLERNSLGNLPQFRSCYVQIKMEYKKTHLIYRKSESTYLFSVRI